MTIPQGSFYYQHDALGSISNVTSESGATEWCYSYEPFGAVRSYFGIRECLRFRVTRVPERRSKTGYEKRHGR